MSFLRSVWAACAASVALRVLWIFMFPGKWWNNDSQFYFLQAERISEGRWLHFFPNGYPLLIFVVDLLCGGRRDVVVGVLLGLNVCLAALSVWLVWDICRRMGGQVIHCALAAWLMALWPQQINYAGQLMSEVSATFFLLLCFRFILEGRCLGAGLCASAMVFLRTTLAPVALLWAVWFFFRRSQRVAAFCLLSGTILGFVLEWGGGVVSGKAEGRGNLGINFIIAARTEGGRFDVPKCLEIGTVSTMEGAKVYFESLVTDPGRFMRQRLLALWELWGLWPDPGNWVSPVTGNIYGRSFGENLALGLRFPFFVAALFFLFRRWRDSEMWVMFIPVLSITAVHVVFYALPRYTFSAEPFVFLLFAVSLSKSSLFVSIKNLRLLFSSQRRL